MWPRVQRVVWLNGLNFLIVSHHFAEFSDHRPCGSSVTAAKTVYMTLQNHVIKESGDLMEGSSSLHIPSLPKLIVTDTVLIDI